MSSYTVSAVDRALTLLEVLAEHPHLGVTELAERTGNTKSLVFRLLYTLERRGYVRKDPATRTYSLGQQPLFLADRARVHSRLIAASRPYLDELAAATNENVLLTVREGSWSVTVAVRESSQPLRLYAANGRRRPLHAGGAPKVLLAFAPEEVRRAVLGGDLPRFTPHTITDPARLAEALAEIRRHPVVESQGELDDAACSVAAPVRDHTGDVVAALSIAGPVSRLAEPVRKGHRFKIADAAALVGRAYAAAFLDAAALRILCR